MSYTWCSLEAVQQRVVLDCLSLHFGSTERQASRTAALVAALTAIRMVSGWVVCSTNILALATPLPMAF